MYGLIVDLLNKSPGEPCKLKALMTQRISASLELVLDFMYYK